MAYVHAVSGRAGVNLQVGARHDYGVDGTLLPVVNFDGRRVQSGHPVDFQLKSTINWEYDEDSVIYDLEAKTYNDMVSRGANAIPLILILLCLPRDTSLWTSVTEHELTLRHCCYWENVRGEPSDNKTTKRIRIPRANLLTADAIIAIIAAERARWSEV